MMREQIEFYFVIMKALERGPFKELSEKMKQELSKQVDDIRYDFQGKKHERDLTNLLARYPNLEYTNKLLLNATRHWLNNRITGVKHRQPNITTQLRMRKIHGPKPMTKTIPVEFYNRLRLHAKVMGHLSSTYCVCFDHTGQYIFTGADDHLIKIWCARDGRLLKTLRGHETQVCDMSVNFENRLLATVSMDKIIRIWDLKTTKLLECLSTHSATVTSIKFSPYNRHGKDRYLISTSNDGTVVIWVYHVDKFGFKRLQRHQERNRVGAQITCSSMSTGGSFLACGSSDHCIHIYGFHYDIGPYHLAELGGHTDKVDSIQFCNLGFRFVTGSKDGTAIIWTYKRSSWVPLRLDMDTNLEQKVIRAPNSTKPMMVLIVQWTKDDKYVITSLIDYSIKVWDSRTGRLVHILRGHQHDIYLIEAHPTDPRIFVSAGHDGIICVWDITTGKLIKKFYNEAELQENNLRAFSSVYDVKFSPDGLMMATTDCHGFLSLYGFGSNDLYKPLPREMFFHTDYRPVIRDLNNFVMDENTHIAPHLLPKPILVDMNGNPYGSQYQKLVPDYHNGERYVIPPLTKTQLDSMSNVLELHSLVEDDDYICEKKPPRTYLDDSDDTIVDSDATEIDEEYLEQQRPPVRHNLRNRSYGNDRRSNQAERRHSERLRKRPRIAR